MKISKKLLSIIITLLLVIILLIISIINISNQNYEDNITNSVEVIKENDNLENIKLVTNPHMYFTVKSCVEKYLTYLNQSDASSIYKILDYEYKKEFNISEENVLEHVEKIENKVKVTVEEMYVLEINENEHEYYVSTVLQKDLMDEIPEEKLDFTVTVKLDLKNMIYSIIPNGYGGPLYEKK